MVDKDAHRYADERIATPLKMLIALMLVFKAPAATAEGLKIWPY